MYSYSHIVTGLLEEFPELREAYAAEIARIDDTFSGQETNGQTVYFDKCFCGFIGRQLSADCPDHVLLRKVFDFLERMAASKDPDTRDLLQVTVLEYLRSWYLLQNRAEKLMLPETRRLFAYVKSYLQEPSPDVRPFFE